MSWFYSIFLWIAMMTVLASIIWPKQSGRVERTVGERYPVWFAILVFIPIILMVGLRENIFDTPAYVNSFLKMPNTVNGLISYIAHVNEDVGFEIFSGIIHLIFGSNKTAYLLMIALIQGLSLCLVYRKYSTSYMMSVFLFIASTDYISWMYNGIRQFLAATIIFAATGLMLKKKYIPLLIIILLASTIHLSAIIMIPLVFIAQGRPWNKRTLSFIGAMLLIVLFVNRFTNFLDMALMDTQYSNVVGYWQSINDDGTSFLRVAVYSVPALIALIGHKQINRVNNSVINLCVNMSVMSMGLYILSMFTSGIYIGRLPIYCSLYGYILLPWEIKIIFEKKSSQLLTIVMIITYLLFYYYQVYLGWQLR